MNLNIVPPGLQTASPLFDSAGVSSPLSTIAGLSGEDSVPDVKEVARDFESIFMSLILKQLRESLGSGDEGGGLFPSDKSGSLGGLFDMFLGQNLAESQSLGVAQMVTRYLASAEDVAAKTEPAAVDIRR